MADRYEIDPTVPPSGPGCVECLAVRGLVVPPASVCALRPCRLLRLVAVAAREPPRRGRAAPGRPELRARRGLVLGLRNRGVPRRSRPGSAAPPPARPARSRTGRTRARQTGSGCCTEVKSDLSPLTPGSGPAPPQRRARDGAHPDDRPRRAQGEARPGRRLQADHGPQPLGVRRQAHPGLDPFRHAR